MWNAVENLDQSLRSNRAFTYRCFPRRVLPAHEHLWLALKLAIRQGGGVEPPEHVRLLERLKLGVVQALEALHDCRRGLVLIRHRHGLYVMS